MKKLLTQAQAEAVYSAMGALNKVNARLLVHFMVADPLVYNAKEIIVYEGPEGNIGIEQLHSGGGSEYIKHARSRTYSVEEHANQSAYATAYGLQG